MVFWIIIHKVQGIHCHLFKLYFHFYIVCYLCLKCTLRLIEKKNSLKFLNTRILNNDRFITLQGHKKKTNFPVPPISNITKRFKCNTIKSDLHFQNHKLHRKFHALNKNIKPWNTQYNLYIVSYNNLIHLAVPEIL